MLTVKTSRVSTVKRIFCLTVALVALVGLGLMPAYEWAASAARVPSPAPVSASVGFDRDGQIFGIDDEGNVVVVRVGSPTFRD